MIDVPAFIRDRLVDLEQGAADAEAFARSAFVAIGHAQNKLAAAMNSRDASTTPEQMAVGKQEVAALEARVVRLQAEAAERHKRANSARQVAEQCAGWLRRLPVGTVLEEAPVRLTGTADAVAVKRLSDRLSALRQDLSRVRAALPSLDELRESIRDRVAEMADRGRPAVTVDRDMVDVHFGRVERVAGIAKHMADPTDVLAWLFPDRMVERLQAELPSAPGSMTRTEREHRIVEIEAEIEQAEREEVLIQQARADGVDIDRWPDVLPEAILGARVLLAQRDLERVVDALQCAVLR
jgi:hypothetical protein